MGEAPAASVGLGRGRGTRLLSRAPEARTATVDVQAAAMEASALRLRWEFFLRNFSFCNSIRMGMRKDLGLVSDKVFEF